MADGLSAERAAPRTLKEQGTLRLERCVATLETTARNMAGLLAGGSPELEATMRDMGVVPRAVCPPAPRAGPDWSSPRPRLGHQLNRPVGCCPANMRSVPAGAQINWRRGLAAAAASHAFQERGQGPITVALDEPRHREHHGARAAMHLEAALRPVRKAMIEAQRRRVHPATLSREHKKNKDAARLPVGCSDHQGRIRLRPVAPRS